MLLPTKGPMFESANFIESVLAYLVHQRFKSSHRRWVEILDVITGAGSNISISLGYLKADCTM